MFNDINYLGSQVRVFSNQNLKLISFYMVIYSLFYIKGMFGVTIAFYF